MNTKLVWATAVLIAIMIFPSLHGLSFLAGLGLIGVVLTWVFVNTQGFLSAVWRTLLFLVLGYSLSLVILIGSASLNNPDVLNNGYGLQFLWAGIIGFILSASGLTRSFYLGHQRRLQGWPMAQ